LTKVPLLLAAALGLGTCATNIQPRDQTIQPSVRLTGFQAVELAPLTVEQMEGNSGDRAAVQRIDDELQACLRAVFPALSGPASAGAANTLLIEPAIVLKGCSVIGMSSAPV
jgi:hypothetical protein